MDAGLETGFVRRTVQSGIDEAGIECVTGAGRIDDRHGAGAASEKKRDPGSWRRWKRST